MIVSGQKAIADVFKVTVMTINNWQAEDPPFPIAKRGKMPRGKSEYETADCIRWYVARQMARAHVETPRDRLDRIRSDREELELAVRLDELVEVSSIQPAIDEFFNDVKAELDGMCNAYTEVMSAAKDKAEQFQVFRRIAREIRERLARFDFRASAGLAVNPGADPEA